MTKIKLWILQSSLWRFFITQVLWRFRFSNGYGKYDGAQFEALRAKLNRGDILFSSDRHKLVSYLIPGEVSHAAIYVNSVCVIEATHLGVQVTTLFDFCKESDLVIAGRCINFDEDYTESFIANARELIGKPYDASLSLGTEALYCSELIYQADRQKRIKYNLKDLVGLGRPYISPQGLLESTNIKRLV